MTSRAELEEVAFALFARRGFEATSVEDIAAAAGIGRRTFFRYYNSKNDLVWGDFTAELERMAAWLDALPADAPLMDGLRSAVVAFNRVGPDQLERHRQRVALIFGVPTLFADSTLRFAEWRAVVAHHVAGRRGGDPGDLGPRLVGHAALGAAVAAYERWLAGDARPLDALLDRAMTELADGFAHLEG